MTSTSLGERLSTYLNALFERRGGQIPALDGLRAMAITAVIAAHSKYDFISAGGTDSSSLFFRSIGYGWVGVDLFFVLSGFLIGKMLLEEFQSTHTVKPLQFILRRGLRIWPLYYFVTIVALVGLLRTGRLPDWSSLIPDFLLLTNFYGERLAFGSWSLSVEEQFYLIMPAILIVFRKKLVRSPKRILWLFAALLSIAPLLRFLKWITTMRVPLDPRDVITRIIHDSIFTHYDGLVIGLLLAALVIYVRPEALIRRSMSAILSVCAIGTGVLAYFHSTYFLFSFLASIFGLATWHCLSRPEGVLARMLSWPPLRIISRLSYGMYLWYRFPLWKIAYAVVGSVPSLPPFVLYFIIFVLTFISAAMISTITFVCVESPFLELRKRISPFKATQPDLASKKLEYI